MRPKDILPKHKENLAGKCQNLTQTRLLAVSAAKKVAFGINFLIKYGVHDTLLN